MKFYICALLLLSLLAIGHCDEARGYFKDSDYPGKCVHEGLILSPGEQGKPKGLCILFLCDAKDGFGRIQDCGFEMPKPNCTFGDYINIDAPFPVCCKKHQYCA